MLRDVFHAGCSWTPFAPDPRGGEWICEEGKAYLLPGALIALTVAVLLFAPISLALRPRASDRG
ncbi:hypothetical protein [Kineococcus glutinatus]|uniref:Uncharacterized protein n=1 Tax=Kineococcus glutinatus TaxID=1070872 RepID=A0ABP9HPP8_9ACTN